MRRSNCPTCEAWETQRPRSSRPPSGPAAHSRENGARGGRHDAPNAPCVEYKKRTVNPVPEESRDCDADKMFWNTQFEKLESNIRGTGGVTPEAAWAVLPETVLNHVAPIIKLQLPVLDTDKMPRETKSQTHMYWRDIPLPPEVDTMDVKAIDEQPDWRFAEIPEDAAEYRTFKRGSEVGLVDLPAWYKLAKKSASGSQKIPSTSPASLLAREKELIEVKVERAIKEAENEDRFIVDREVEGEEEEEDVYEELETDIGLYEPEEQETFDQEIEQEKKAREMLDRKEMKRRESKINKLIQRISLYRETIEEEEQSKELDRLGVDLEVQPASTCPRDEGHFSWPYMPRNPYYKFLKKSKAKAATWRPPERPQTSGEAMDTSVLLHPVYSLMEKAKHITSTITTEFLAWMEGLGGAQKTELTHENLQQLFDVTFDLPAAHSLCVRVRELPVVTKQVAEAAFAPEAETHEGLRLKLKQDVEVEGLKKHVVAFGRRLDKCCPQRFVPPRNNVRRTWVDCGRLPEELATAKEVFQGITQNMSVQKFCEYLERNPMLAVPPYLRSIGMVGLTGLAADRARRRGGFLPVGKRPKTMPPKSSILRKGAAAGQTSALHAADKQVVRGHVAGFQVKYEQSTK